MKPVDKGFWGHLWKEALPALSLGWDLAIPIFGGVILGSILDRYLDTRPTFTLGLLLSGIGIGYYNILRFIRRVEKRDQAEAEAKAERKEDEL
jgi:F0F1-type ATP synthase assembly protein I